MDHDNGDRPHPSERRARRPASTSKSASAHARRIGTHPRYQRPRAEAGDGSGSRASSARLSAAEIRQRRQGAGQQPASAPQVPATVQPEQPEQVARAGAEPEERTPGGPGRRLSAAEIRQARQQGGERGGPKAPVRGPRTVGAHAPRAHAVGRAALSPVAETVKSRRWSRKRIAFVATPLIVVAVAAALIVPTLLKAKRAYDQIFTDPIPHYQVTVNAAGTPVINPSVTEAAQLPDWDKKERINILLLGVDEDPARLAQGEPPLSDTMILVTVDPVTKQVGMLSIPRDLKVMIPGVGETKINAAYSAGSLSSITGAGLVRTTIETNFHITIHYVVQVNFEGFQKIINTLGGVTLDVPAPVKDDQYPGQAFNYTRVLFQTGLQHMDGQTALSYARTRHDDSDFGRGNRQQQVLMALRQQAVSLNLITKAPQLLEELGNTFKTDIPPGDMLKLAKLASQVKGDQIHSYNLLSATTVDAPPGQPYYLIPEWDKINQLLAQMMPPTAGATPTARAGTPAPAPTSTLTPTSTAATAAQPNLSAKILVQNATRTNKLAASNAAKLQAAGFTGVDTGQSPETGAYPASRIVVYNGDMASAGLIADTLGLPRSAIVPEPGGGSYDLVVILGNDVAAKAGT